MATSNNSGTHSFREAMNFTLLPDPIINLVQCDSSLDHCNLIFDVDGDFSKLEHVEDDKGFLGDLGDTLVIMATALDSDSKFGGFGADYSALHVDSSRGVTTSTGFGISGVL